jgi:hypothetical protein
MDGPEPTVEPIRGLPALEIAERLQCASAEGLVELVNSAALSPDRALGFMDGCVTVSEHDESAKVRCSALVALLQLLVRDRQFVDEFVAAKLHEKIHFNRPDNLIEALSLFIPIAAIHPEVVMHESIISCLRLQPRKVLRLFSVLSSPSAMMTLVGISSTLCFLTSTFSCQRTSLSASSAFSIR